MVINKKYYHMDSKKVAVPCNFSYVLCVLNLPK